MTNLTSVNVLYVGNRPILDTAQGNGIMEDAGTMLGNYQIGSDAVYHNLTVQHDPAVVDGLLATNDYGASASHPDGLYNEGFNNTPSGGFSEIDSQQLFYGDVTYRDIDGSVKTMTDVPFNMYQLENGDTFMVPTGEIASAASGSGDPGQFTASDLSGRDILNVELTEMRTEAIGHDNLLYDWESLHDEVQTFYLGNQDILDTTQGNGVMEGASALVGAYDATGGTPGEGEFTLHTLWARHDASVNDELLATNDYGASASHPDGLYDEGFANTPSGGQAGTSFSEIDSQQLFWGNVYYRDANGVEQVMTNVGLDVYQLENGDVFAVPTREILSGDGTFADVNDTSPSVLSGLSITRIELVTLRDNAIGHDSLLYDSESIGDEYSGATLGLTPDGIVDGTAGAETMGPGYTDADSDQIDGSDGLNDTILAGAGNDSVDGGLGGDLINGELGDDQLYGNDGADTLIGGAGADTLTGGAGADLFIVDYGGDTITDFDTTAGIGNGDDSDNDVVDLSAFYNDTTLAAWNATHPEETYANPLGWLRADQADGRLDQAGGLELYGTDGNSVPADDLNAENTRVVCFTRGTRILTPRGEIAIEQLVAGDRVLTLDNGFKPISWIGHKHLAAEVLRKAPHVRPIRIAAGALDTNLPLRDLVVSPQHRILIRSPHAELMLGSNEVLIAAKHLLGLPGVSVDTAATEVEYWHFLFDQHEVVFAEGIASESLYTGNEALKSLSAEARDEIFLLFPELAQGGQIRAPEAARPLVKGALGRMLAQQDSRYQTARHRREAQLMH